jgi:hypothetical protein
VIDQDEFEEGEAGVVDEVKTPLNLRAEIEKARSDRLQEVMTWDLCFRQLAGDQNYEFDRARTKIRAITSTPGKNSTITNQLLQVDRTWRGLMSTATPKFTVVPGSPSWDDITKALAAEMVCRYLYSANKVKRILAANNRWLMGAGNAALHVFFDPAKQSIGIEGVSPYDLLFEYGAQTYDESAWVAIRHIYRREDLKEQYPEFATQIADCAALSSSDQRTKMPTDRVETWEVYHRDGRHFILLGNQETTYLYKGRTPQGVMPVMPYRAHAIANRIYGQPVLWPLLDLQWQINRFKNFGLDIADAISNPVWVVPFNSGVNPGHLTNEPGKPIFYQPHAPAPQRQAAPAVPPHLFEIQTRALGEMMDVSGIHSTTMGKRASGVTSGKAIEALSENDLGQLRATMDDVEDAVADALRVALVYWQTYLPESQNIKFFDEAAGAVVFKEVAGTDLVGNPEVFIEMGSLFAVTQEDRERRLMNLVTAGVIQPAEYLKETSLKLGQKSASKKMVALSHAQDLLAACRMGQQIEIFPSDDLEAIKDVFEEFINSPAYYEEMNLALEAQRSGDPTAQQTLLEAAMVQDYIREVLVSVSVPMGTGAEQIKALASAKVFPAAPQLVPPEQQGVPGPRPMGEGDMEHTPGDALAGNGSTSGTIGG